MSNSTEIFWTTQKSKFKFKIQQEIFNKKDAEICSDVPNILLLIKITFNVLKLKRKLL